MSNSRRILFPVGAGLAGGAILFALYVGIMSIAESPQHAIEFLWRDRGLVLPIITGFGVQVALFVILKLNNFVSPADIRQHRTLTGVNGVTSTIGMVACCAHHVVDVLSVIGLSSVASFLAAYRTSLMVTSLIITLMGIGFMLIKLQMNRHKVASTNPASRVLEVR